jgi:hypothetical protein
LSRRCRTALARAAAGDAISIIVFIEKKQAGNLDGCRPGKSAAVT